MVFTAFCKVGESRIDVFYDPINNLYSMVDSSGVVRHQDLNFDQALNTMNALRADAWKQMDFAATAVLTRTEIRAAA